MQGRTPLRVTLLCLLLPTTEPKRDRLTGVAQPVGVSTIVHGAGDDHAAHAERRDRLSRTLRVATTGPHIGLQKADHAGEHALECSFSGFARPCDVAGKSDHRARILDVLEMLA